MKNKLLIGILIAFLFAGCGKTGVSQSSDQANMLQRFENGFPILGARGILFGETTTLSERMEHYYVPGVSIAVINDYEIEWAQGYGVLDAKGNQPVTPESRFPAASIGKTLTAVAAMRYVEEGLLDLDRNVNEVLTSWAIPENEFTVQSDVTLRRLLSHTAGVSVSGFRGYLQGEELPTLIQILDGEPPANNPPIRVDMVPGSQWRYSGGGYQIVEQLLVDVAGKPFPVIMQETVIGPTGMTSTTYAAEVPTELEADIASAHNRWGQPIVGKWLNQPYMGTGGVLTTPGDLARFASRIMLAVSGRSDVPLSKETAGMMLAPQAEGIPFMGPLSMDWGLGWQLNDLLGETFVSHGGDFPEGYQTLLVTVPDRGWGVVIMTNGANGDALRLEILYSLSVQYGILPALWQLALWAYLLLLVVSWPAVWVIVFLFRIARRRKNVGETVRQETGRFRRLIQSVVITTAVVSLLYATTLLLGPGVLSGPPDVSPGQAQALGQVAQGELLAEHGRLTEALEAFEAAQSLEPDLEIPAGAWNHLCIRGCVWGYVNDVFVACEKAVVLAPKDDGMLFGRGLARALSGEYSGAISDFTNYVEWTKDKGFYDPYGMEVEGFLIELAAGRQPFDETQLDEWK